MSQIYDYREAFAKESHVTVPYMAVSPVVAVTLVTKVPTRYLPTSGKGLQDT